MSRYVISSSIQDFGDRVTAIKGAASTATMRFLIALAPDDDILSISVTFQTDEEFRTAPAEHYVGEMRLWIEEGTESVLVEGTTDRGYNRISREDDVPIRTHLDIANNRVHRIDVTSGATSFMAPIWLAVRADGSATGTLRTLWSYIKNAVIGVVMTQTEVEATEEIPDVFEEFRKLAPRQ